MVKGSFRKMAMTRYPNPATILTAATRGPKAARHVAGTCQETQDGRNMGNNRQQGGARRRSAAGWAGAGPKRAAAILGLVHYRAVARNLRAGVRRGAAVEDQGERTGHGASVACRGV